MNISLIKTISTFSIICIFLSSCEETIFPVTSINLDSSFLIIVVDSTAALVAEIEPLDASNKTLKWISSDTTIAKVNSKGIISGISPGTANISVESSDGHLKTCDVSIIKIIEHYPIKDIDFGASPYMDFDSYDNLWYGGNGGIYNTGPGRNFHPIDSEVEAFDFDSNNNIWVATTTLGLLKFDGQTWTNFDTLNSELPTNRITAVCVDQNDVIWVGLGGNRYDSKKVGRFDGVQWKIFESKECLISEWGVFKIIADKQNNIWFAHYNGVSLFDDSNWELFVNNNENSLDIETDSENNIWFTSSFNGIFKYDGTKVTNYNTSNSSIYSNYIQSVGIDKNGNKWLGVTNGVIRFDGNKWYNLAYPDFNISDIRSIAIDSEGNKWLASPSKIYQLIE